MTPIEAAEIEVRAELAALARRLGSATVMDALTIHIAFDRETGMPRTVECREERTRRVLRGTIPTRDRRHAGAA